MTFLRILLLALILGSVVRMPADGPSPELAVLLTEGRWEEAVNQARRNLELNTLGPEAWFDLGYVLFLEGRMDRLNEAVECLATAVDLNPSSAESWYWLGRAQGQAAGSGGVLGRLKAARRTKEAFLRSCELSPDNFRYSYALIQFHLQAPALAGGDREQAAQLAAGFTNELPEEKALLRASVALDSGDLGLARELLERVNDFSDPLVAETWRLNATQLGGALLSRKEWDAADLTYGRVIDRFPDDPGGYRGRGRALEGAGRSEEAHLNFEKAAELAGD